MMALRRMAPRMLAAVAVALMVSAPTISRAEGNFYQQHNLVSDVPNAADHTDPNLVNAWGIVFSATGPVWIADNGTGLSTLYNGAGNPLSLVVQIPGPSGTTGNGAPTGIVVNTNSGFVVSNGTTSGASR